MKFRIKEARESIGLSQKELAQKIGVAPNTFHGYESGKHDPKSDMLIKIANVCGVTVDFLLGRNDKFDSVDLSKVKSATPKMDTADSIAHRYKKLDEHGKLVVCAVVSEEERRMQSIRKPDLEDNVIHVHWNDQPASAGEGFDLSDEHMEDWMVRYNELTRKADFCLNIQGHSMEPKFHDGDIALIRQQPSVDVGEIGLFVVDGKGYIKKQGPDRLISLNPTYADIWPGEFSDAQCVGKVLGVLDPNWIVSR